MTASKKHRNNQSRNWLVYRINDRFLAKYSIHYKGKLYDLGCGDAVYRDYFLKFVDEYVGVDWPQSIHGKHANVFADLNKPFPIDSNVADTAVAISVMEHLYEPQQFLCEAHRILRQGGVLLLQVPWQWWIHEAPHDYFRYTPYGLRFMCERAGFSEISIEPSSGFFTMWFLKAIYFSNRFIVGPRIWRGVLRVILTPIWFVLQVLAPYLDKLDKNWEAESQGYYVLARKSVEKEVIQ